MESRVGSGQSLLGSEEGGLGFDPIMVFKGRRRLGSEKGFFRPQGSRLESDNYSLGSEESMTVFEE